MPYPIARAQCDACYYVDSSPKCADCGSVLKLREGSGWCPYCQKWQSHIACPKCRTSHHATFYE